MASKSNLTVVLDIGTSKMVALAGYLSENNTMVVAGIAKGPAKGIRRGVIVNIEEVAESVRNVLSKIDGGFDRVHIAFAGQHFKTINFQCSKSIREEGVVSQDDISLLHNEAKKAGTVEGYRILDIIPRNFVIDDEKVQNPVGCTGSRIVANFKLVVLPESYYVNLQRVFERVGVEMGEIVLSSLAVSEAVITDEEKEMGVIVLDMGAGTSSLAVFHENTLVHTAVIPFGGDVVTNDIREGCSILYKWAEQLKVQYGEALGDFADDQKYVTIPGHKGWETKEISFRSLAFIIQARIEEIIDCVAGQIEKSGINGQLGGGIVITGGTSNLKNIVSLVKFRTGMDVRKADLAIRLSEKNPDWDHPDNYTALGLLKMMLEKQSQAVKVSKKVSAKKKGLFAPWISKVVQGVLEIVDDDNEDLDLK